MKNVIPLPKTAADEPSEEDGGLAAAVSGEVQGVAGEPTPERLVQLARDLGRALDARQAQDPDLDPDG